MKTYLVGGAVRDLLLGLEPKDYDYVVVGSSVEEMLSLGFIQVGKDFPVFLHPVTKAEHALARREKSTGTSYLDFECDVEGVTLEQDLLRRDLTINSMAMDEDGTIIDPFGGQNCLRHKILKATSEAFGEDPLRVLRAARFHARLGEEWVIDGVTKGMMKALAKRVRTEVSPERVWQEVSKALEEKSPWLFLNTLCEVFEVPTAGNKTFGLEEVEEKRLVEGSIWTVFLLHLSTTDAARLSNAVCAPASFHKLFHNTLAIFRAPKDLSAEGHLDILIRLKALHENTSLTSALITLSAMLPPDEIDALIIRWLNVLSAARSVTSTDLTRRGFAGKLLGSKMREARIKKIEEVLSHGS